MIAPYCTLDSPSVFLTLVDILEKFRDQEIYEIKFFVYEIRTSPRLFLCYSALNSTYRLEGAVKQGCECIVIIILKDMCINRKSDENNIFCTLSND